jgi:hypothetical protein
MPDRLVDILPADSTSSNVESQIILKLSVGSIFKKVAGGIPPIVISGINFLTQIVHNHLVKENNIDSSFSR